jgi:HPt (histidine-containing phosphotransfer) domain-containing protein
MSGGSAVDFAYLEGFAQGDRTVISEVFDIFLEQAAIWAPKLDAASTDLKTTAHTIKGAARGVGAYALGDAAARVEAEGPGTLDQLQQALVEAVAEVEAYKARS